ncbi:MAG: acetate kinase [Ruminococcus sp.]|nr:acetate kinase [Ruminococcus sp.]MBR3918861.1 acetate kinase [Clostridia bacterium]
MNILVINCGSSSLKYQLIDSSNENVLAKGLCDRIGIADSFIKQTVTGKDATVINVDLKDHNIAIAEVVKALTSKEHGVIESLADISAVGHRIVHGGEKFCESVIIDDEAMKAIEDCVPLAPLHNPANIIGIKACQAAMPGVPQVAVFDTAFHQTMPSEAYMYALPYEYYTKHGIRKYGFHGTSHKYVAERCAALMEKPIEDLKIITCHIGNGGSIAAVKGGKCMDTSMGFTPLDGLEMGTRSGILDPAVVLFLMDNENLSSKDMNTVLNKKSGLAGVSGVSSDMRDVTAAAKEGNERAKLALDIFAYRVKSYIGQYAAVMNGVDAIVFTAGIGENDIATRLACASGLEYLGVSVDADKNNVRGGEVEISADGSKVKVFVISTNEELAIARETARLTK